MLESGLLFTPALTSRLLYPLHLRSGGHPPAQGPSRIWISVFRQPKMKRDVRNGRVVVGELPGGGLVREAGRGVRNLQPKLLSYK
jgi:hypothetical protein